MIYFTSDWHFCHNKPFIYESRGFKSIEEMNEIIIENHNRVVKEEDIIYCLGDCMLNDNQKGMECINRLNGYKVIILGNHCTDTRIKLYKNLPNTEVKGWADMLKYGNYHFYLSHYPTITSNHDENRPLKQIILNLHGHTHDRRKFYQDNPTMYNVALDAHNNTPVSIDQMIEDIKAKRDKCEKLLWHFKKFMI